MVELLDCPSDLGIEDLAMYNLSSHVISAVVYDKFAHSCFYRASICEGGLGSRNSVRLSVRLPHAWIVTKLNDALHILITHERAITLLL